MTDETVPAELRSALAQLARTPRLLVACDYDGTLAPIVDDPDRALPHPESVAALRSLAALPASTVAVVSGRAFRDLAALTGLSQDVHLIGSHGAEFEAGLADALGPEARALHEKLRAELSRLADRPGVGLEVKPASIAVHVREAPPEVGEAVLAAVRDGPAGWDGVHVTEGKAVIELAVVHTDKGAALDLVRERVDATAVVFLGDDVTDEKAFARLAGADVGVKVGPGETAAGYRVPRTEDVTAVLALLLELRQPP